MSTRKTKSPYRRHNKTPFHYSELYQGWKAAKLRNDEATADEFARKHFNRFVRFGDELFGPMLGPVQRLCVQKDEEGGEFAAEIERWLAA